MDKKQLIEDMEKTAGGRFITARQVADYYGVANAGRFRQEHLQGLQTVGKRYYIPDVATRFLAIAEVEHG